MVQEVFQKEHILPPYCELMFSETQDAYATKREGSSNNRVQDGLVWFSNKI